MDGLIEGRIVHYVLTESDVDAITKSRMLNPVAKQGNSVLPGLHFPAIVVRVFPQEFGSDNPGVNLQVFLDGNDSLWVTSRKFAVPEVLENGTWHWIEKA